MRRTGSVFLVAVALALISSRDARAQESKKGRCYVREKAEFISLRERPDAASPETAKARYGQMLVYDTARVEKGPDKKRWVFVADPYGEQQGWAPETFLSANRPAAVDRGTFKGVAHTTSGVTFQPAAELALLQLSPKGEGYFRRKAERARKEKEMTPEERAARDEAVKRAVRQLVELEAKVAGAPEAGVEGILPDRAAREKKGKDYAARVTDE